MKQFKEAIQKQIIEDSIEQATQTAETMNELNRQIESGGGKPRFDKITTLTIKEATFKIDKTKPVKDKKGNEYFPFWLGIKYLDSNEQESFETFGGGHRYSDVDWIGSKSALGELKALVDATYDYDGSLEGLLKAIVSQKVGVLSVKKQGFGGEEISKNLIQHFK